jgi:hypothetical protein
MVAHENVVKHIAIKAYPLPVNWLLTLWRITFLPWRLYIQFIAALPIAMSAAKCFVARQMLLLYALKWLCLLPFGEVNKESKYFKLQNSKTATAVSIIFTAAITIGNLNTIRILLM